MDRAMRKRLMGLTVALVVVVPLSVVAARWQWNRHLERDALNAAVITAEAAAPVPWGNLTYPPTPEWRRVFATGQWAPEHQWLVRRQTVNGRVGFLVLTPFRSDEGTWLYVERGWVADATQRIPNCPDGDVRIELRVRAITGDGPIRPSDLPPGQINRVDPLRLAQQPTVPAVLELLDPVPTGLVPLPWPELTSGPHLSYFVQWILIGCTAVIVYVRVMSLEIRRRDDDE